FWYLKDGVQDESVKTHYACPCCVAHFDQLVTLRDHFYADHRDYVPSPKESNNGTSASINGNPQEEPALLKTISNDASIDHSKDVSIDSDFDSIIDNSNDSTIDNGSDTTNQSNNLQQGGASVKRSHDELLTFDLSFGPLRGKHLMAGNFDTSEALYKMQSSLKQYKWKVSLEDHVHMVLAATSILLLTPNKYPDENTAISSIKTIYDIQPPPMPLNLVGDLLGILDKLVRGSFSRMQAEMSLKALAQEGKEFKFVIALSALVTRLPRFPMEEDVNETELCMRFVDPFLTGLFDDPDNGMYFRWTNETTMEAKQNNGCIDRRPDLCITKSCGVKWGADCGYGEAKPSARDNDHYLVCMDLVRVAILSKEALNSQRLDGVLGIQIVGRTLMFYVLLLPAEGIYTLLQLAEVKIPDSLQNLSHLVMDVSNILTVMDVFDRLCVSSDNPQIIIDRKTPTVPLDVLQQLFSVSKDRKRPCHLKRRHN
ncbi:hypothetical protein DFQ29_001289, partial [Apophysomyces sp. BC1021]